MATASAPEPRKPIPFWLEASLVVGGCLIIRYAFDHQKQLTVGNVGVAGSAWLVAAGLVRRKWALAAAAAVLLGLALVLRG